MRKREIYNQSLQFFLTRLIKKVSPSSPDTKFLVPNKVVTPMGTTNIFFSDEVAATQGDMKMISKSAGTQVVEFDEAAYEVYLSSQSRSPASARAYRGSSSALQFQRPFP